MYYKFGSIVKLQLFQNAQSLLKDNFEIVQNKFRNQSPFVIKQMLLTQKFFLIKYTNYKFWLIFIQLQTKSEWETTQYIKMK